MESPMKAFYTPQATMKTRTTFPPEKSMTERKPLNRDLFHVTYKVPAGDSPYVRAKRVQLIEKDTNRAIAMFWAAINEGDRVDSALKDMAVAMKQLNRSDEAIEAIKSFRRLCPNESQDSIDNILLELYKRCGRNEEEIEMLKIKLRQLEEGKAFGGKRTKTARSQGKIIHVTAEQEQSRLLGNLAWAYLQQHNYGLAEKHYLKALALDSDGNKKCNLAICYMHMNRIVEARSLLESVRAASGDKEMDESYAKSYERAVQMLTDFESGFKPTSYQQNGRATSSDEGILLTQPWKAGGSNTTGVEAFGSVNQKLLLEPTPQSIVQDGRAASLDEGILLTQPRKVGGSNTTGVEAFDSVNRKLLFEPTTQSTVQKPIVFGTISATLVTPESLSKELKKKSWADMVEEDEMNGLTEYYDENVNISNVNVNAAATSENSVSSKKPAVRRSLCFKQQEQYYAGSTKYYSPSPVSNMCGGGPKRNRLRVFQDITP